MQMATEGWVLTSGQPPTCKMGRILLHLPQVYPGVGSWLDTGNEAQPWVYGCGSLVV